MSVESTYTSLQKKQWRALIYNYENMIDGLSGDSKLYCLTDFQRVWLQSNVDYMRFPTRWTNLTITNDELNQLADDLELALMSCVDIQPYQVQFTYNQAVKQTLNDLQSAYDLGGITQLNPNTPTDFYNGDDSLDRNAALCTACKLYVYSYASNWVTIAQTTLGIAVLFGIGASLTIVGGIIASVLVGGLAFITQAAINAMTDETALDNVVCCMFNSLQGQPVNQLIFENSLDSCGFLVGSNEAIIRDIIASDLDQFKNWLSFLNSVGDSYVYAQVGVSDCPCFVVPSEVCYSWVNGSESWFSIGSTGEFVSTGYRMRTNQQFAVGALRFQVGYSQPIPLNQVTGCKITWDFSSAVVSGTPLSNDVVEFTYTDSTQDFNSIGNLDFPASGFVGELEYSFPPSDPNKTISQIRIIFQKNSGNSGTGFATAFCLVGN